ncbi:MAG: hypothetical protein K0S85_4689, partial [Pseudomonas orientalis]|nr:hypothetical protein [Pseudomonas orientalis]
MKLPQISTFITQWPSLGLGTAAAWQVA